MTLKKIHFISGFTITIFIVLHLFNHLASVLGAEKHIELMNLLRLFYRNVFVETLLLLAVFIQIVSGLKLFKVNYKLANNPFEKLQIWTGLYLAIFFMIHLSAVFAGRIILKLDTNFYFGIAGLNTFPLNLFFIPYYGLAILSFFGHIAAIHVKKMKINIFGFSPKSQSVFILVLGFFVTIIVFYGLTNKFNGFEIQKVYNILIGK